MPFNVLIVDDSPVMCKFIRRVLILSGLEMGECIDAGDGREALELLKTKWIDIILTDINMPVMDGEELMQNLAVDQLTGSIPVIVISTDRSEERLRRMFKLGAKDYVTKPFLPETLGRVMIRLLMGESNAHN
jgi:two-component system chemotaxis response regulator CheY